MYGKTIENITTPDTFTNPIYGAGNHNQPPTDDLQPTQSTIDVGAGAGVEQPIQPLFTREEITNLRRVGSAMNIDPSDQSISDEQVRAYALAIQQVYLPEIKNNDGAFFSPEHVALDPREHLKKMQNLVRTSDYSSLMSKTLTDFISLSTPEDKYKVAEQNLHFWEDSDTWINNTLEENYEITLKDLELLERYGFKVDIGDAETIRRYLKKPELIPFPKELQDSLPIKFEVDSDPFGYYTPTSVERDEEGKVLGYNYSQILIGLGQKYRDAILQARTIDTYHSKLLDQNKWIVLQDIRKNIDGETREVFDLFQTAGDDADKREKALLRFENLPLSEQRKIASAIHMMQYQEDTTWVGDALSALWDTTASLGEGVWYGITKQFYEDEEWQKRAEERAILDMVTTPRQKDWGAWGDATIGVIGTLPYMGAAAIPYAGPVIIMAQAADEMEQQVALQGGDITSLELRTTKYISALAYALVERLQFGEGFGAIKNMSKRELFTQMFSSLKGTLGAGLFIAGTTAKETFEEALQGGIMNAVIACGLNESEAEAFVKRFAEDGAMSWRTMLLISSVGAGVQRHRYKNGPIGDVATQAAFLRRVEHLNEQTFGTKDSNRSLAEFGRTYGNIAASWINAGESTANRRQTLRRMGLGAEQAEVVDNIFGQIWANISTDAKAQSAFVGGGHVKTAQELVGEAASKGIVSVETHEDGSRTTKINLGGVELDLDFSVADLNADIDLMADTEAMNQSVASALGMSVDQWVNLKQTNPTLARERITNAHVSVRADFRLPQQVSVPTDTGPSYKWTIRTPDGGVMDGKITEDIINGLITQDTTALPQSAWHEYIHGASTVLKQLYATNPEAKALVDALAKQYKAQGTNEMFDEETFANAFRDYLTTKIDVVDSNKGIFGKFIEWLKGLFGKVKETKTLIDSPVNAADNLFNFALSGKLPQALQQTNTDAETEQAEAVQDYEQQKAEETETRKSITADIERERAEREYNEVVAKYKDTDQWLKAPNGKPTNLTERQWVQVRTPSFKRWFGDWENDPANASKVVDENGEPLVVYHGTDATFNVFDKGRFASKTGVGILGEGFYFADKAKEAKGYGKNVMPVYLKQDAAYEASDRDVWRLNSAKLEREGYDGVAMKTGVGNIYMVFDPEQIKSATDNVGTFDPSNPDIRFSTTSVNLPETHLRDLEPGETCLIERVFTEQKQFEFTGKNKVSTYDDVAYIFKNLENEAIENAFVVLVKDKKPTILHVGMGVIDLTLADNQAIRVAEERIKPDAIYFVHNHPSGKVSASKQDKTLLATLKSAYGDKVKDGIIINLRSGKYGLFSALGEDSQNNGGEFFAKEPGKKSKLKVFSFNKRVFKSDFNVEDLIQVSEPGMVYNYAAEHELVAEMVSSHRLGERNKISLLVCTKDLRIIGNVFLNHTDVTNSNIGDVTAEIDYYTSAMGGKYAFLYGRFNDANIKWYEIKSRFKNQITELLDVIKVAPDGSWTSKHRDGELEIPFSETSQANENALPYDTSDADARYSVVTIDNKNIAIANNYDGKTDAKSIKEYLKNDIGLMATIIETGVEVHIGNDLPKEYSFSKYSNNIQTQSEDIWDAKANFSPAIQEMIEIATNRRWEKEKHKHKKHQSRFKYGFYRYDSSVAIPREEEYIVYDVELVIRNDAKGKHFLYDIVNIKENAEVSKTLTTKLSQSADMKLLHMRGIKPNSSSEVKNQFSPRNSVTAAEDQVYLDAVKRGDMETAQRMVDEAARLAGYTQKKFHETKQENIINVFDLGLNANASADYGTPFGIFTKSHNRSVGLGGKQMGLFVKAENTFHLKDRTEIAKKLPAEYSELVDTINAIDNEYSPKYEELGDELLFGFDAWLNENDPDDKMREAWDVSKTIEEQFGDVLPQELIEAEREQTRISEEWKRKTDKAVLDAKEWITKWLRDNGYDSMELGFDNGAGGRVTDALIVLDQNQIKSAAPVTYDNDGNVIPLSQRFNAGIDDIRYSLTQGPENAINEKELEKRAYDWINQNLDTAVEDYIQKNGNKLDPDEARTVFAPLGYDGKNVPIFRKAEKVLVNAIFDKMLYKAVSEGKTNITFLTGVGGAGKSTALRNNKDIDLSNEGIVYDSAFNSYDSLANKIEYAQSKGMKNITVIAVHNDAKTAFANTVNRGIATGRFLSLEYFLDGAFRDNKGKIAALLKKHQEINLIAIDNSNNNGGRVVSNEEATNWDYNISEELVYNLLTYIQERFDNGEITKEQLSSIGRGIQEIEELTSKRNEQIASRIAREISSNDLHETSGERVSGLGVNTPSSDTTTEQPLFAQPDAQRFSVANTEAAIINAMAEEMNPSLPRMSVTSDFTNSYSTKSNLVAMMAQDKILGIDRPNEDYQALLNAYNFKDEGDLEDLMAERDKLLRGMKDETGHYAQWSHWQMAQSAEASNFKTVVENLFSGLTGSGVGVGSKAERAWAKALAREVRNATGRNLPDLINDTGFDVVELLLQLPSDVPVIKRPAITDEVIGGGDGVVEGQAETDATTETPINFEARKAQIEARAAEVEARRERILKLLAEWRERERQRKEALERKKAEKANKPSSEFDVEEDLPDEGAEVSSNGSTQTGYESECVEEMPDFKAFIDALKSEDIDVRNIEELAALLHIWVDDWVAHTLKSTDSTMPDRMRDPIALEKYRKTMKQVLRNMMERMVDPEAENAGYAIRQISKSLDLLNAATTPNQIQDRVRSILGQIQRASIRQTRKQLIAELRKAIKLLAIKGKEFDEMERDIGRKIAGEHEKMARYIYKILTWSDGMIAEEAEKLMAIIDGRKDAYKEAGKEFSSKQLEQKDVEVHRAMEKINALNKWGGLRKKSPAEIVRAGDTIKQWLEKERFAHEQRWTKWQEAKDRVANQFIDAINARGGKYQPSDPNAWQRFGDELIATLRQRLEHITQGSGTNGREVVNQILFILNSGSEKLAVTKERYRKQTEEMLKKSVDGTKKKVTDLLRDLEEEVPTELNDILIAPIEVTDAGGNTTTKQDQKVRMTWGQVLQLYASLSQVSYADNVEANGRKGQKQLIERYLEDRPEMIKLVEYMRRLYEERRVELSEQFQWLTGMPIYNPDPLYMPVKMFRGASDNLETVVRAWNPFGPSFTPRIKNRLDFDLSADIMDIFLQRSNEAAKAIAFGVRGMELRSIVARKEVQNAIQQNYGKFALRKIIEQITDTLSDGYKTPSSGFGKAIQVASSATTYSALSWNLVTAIKQMASFPAWSAVLRGGYKEIFSNMINYDRKAARELCESEGFLARYGATSFPELFKQSLNDPTQNWIKKFFKSGMTAIQIGDYVASMLVGTGVYKAQKQALMRSGMSEAEAKNRAASITWSLIEECQQSSRLENTPDWLRRQGFLARQLAKFASSPLLQVSHEFHSMRMWINAAKAEDIDEVRMWRKRFFNQIIANHVIMPALMYGIAVGFGMVLGDEPPEEEELYGDLLLQCLVGPFSRVFLIGSIVEGLSAMLIRTTGLKPNVYDNSGIAATQYLEKIIKCISRMQTDALEADWESFRDDTLDMIGQVVVPARYVVKGGRNIADYDAKAERMKRKREIKKQKQQNNSK